MRFPFLNSYAYVRYAELLLKWGNKNWTYFRLLWYAWLFKPVLALTYTIQNQDIDIRSSQSYLLFLETGENIRFGAVKVLSLGGFFIDPFLVFMVQLRLKEYVMI